MLEIPYFIDGEMIILKGDLAEIIAQIDEKQGLSIKLKVDEVEEETLCLN